MPAVDRSAVFGRPDRGQHGLSKRPGQHSPAIDVFHRACTSAAARASASAEAGIGGLHTGVLAVLILFDIDGTLVPGRPQAHQDALIGALVEVYEVELREGENPVADVEPWQTPNLLPPSR